MTSEHEIPEPRGPNAGGSREFAQMAYEALRGLAAAYLHRERCEHTLQPTALVHEAFIKLAKSGGDSRWASETHFQAVAAKAMRQILVDHARRRATSKRGGGWLRITLADEMASASATDVDVMALDNAMRELSAFDARKSRVVELRFFGGLTCAEAAAQLGVSPKTAEADWYFARAWLRDKLNETDA